MANGFNISSSSGSGGGSPPHDPWGRIGQGIDLNRVWRGDPPHDPWGRIGQEIDLNRVWRGDPPSPGSPPHDPWGRIGQEIDLNRVWRGDPPSPGSPPPFGIPGLMDMLDQDGDGIIRLYANYSSSSDEFPDEPFSESEGYRSHSPGHDLTLPSLMNSSGHTAVTLSSPERWSDYSWTYSDPSVGYGSHSPDRNQDSSGSWGSPRSAQGSPRLPALMGPDYYRNRSPSPPPPLGSPQRNIRFMDGVWRGRSPDNNLNRVWLGGSPPSDHSSSSSDGSSVYPDSSYSYGVDSMSQSFSSESTAPGTPQFSSSPLGIPPDVVAVRSPAQVPADPESLARWYQENFQRVQAHDIAHDQLLSLAQRYLPGYTDREVNSLEHYITVLEIYIEDLREKVDEFSIDINESSGSEIVGKVESHRNRVVQVIERYKRMLNEANDEIQRMRNQNMQLDAELTGTIRQCDHLQRRLARPDSSGISMEMERMAELESRLAASGSRANSLQQELQRQRSENQAIINRLGDVTRERMYAEEESMSEIAGISQQAEINSMIGDAVRSSLRSGAQSPSKEQSDKIVEDWKESITQSLNEKDNEINELREKVNSKNDEIARIQREQQDLQSRFQAMTGNMQRARELVVQMRNREVEEIQDELDELEDCREQIWNESFNTSGETLTPSSPIAGTSRMSDSPLELNTTVNLSPHAPSTFPAFVDLYASPENLPQDSEEQSSDQRLSFAYDDLERIIRGAYRPRGTRYNFKCYPQPMRRMVTSFPPSKILEEVRPEVMDNLDPLESGADDVFYLPGEDPESEAQYEALEQYRRAHRYSHPPQNHPYFRGSSTDDRHLRTQSLTNPPRISPEPIRSVDGSPQLNRSVDGSPQLNRTFDTLPQPSQPKKRRYSYPLRKSPGSSTDDRYLRTQSLSNPPRISPESIRTVDEAPQLNRTFEIVPQLNRTVDEAPQLNRTFEIVPHLNEAPERSLRSRIPRLAGSTIPHLGGNRPRLAEGRIPRPGGNRLPPPGESRIPHVRKR